MRAILVRVGADMTAGGGKWWAPVDPGSNEFVYVPIPEYTKEFQPDCERRFDEVTSPLMTFLESRGIRDGFWARRLQRKLGLPMHLDPDYEHLTYGDIGNVRGRDLQHFASGDLMIFYSSLRPIRPADELTYAMVGLYVVDEVIPAARVEGHRLHENAHTRKRPVPDADIVVRARPGVSGRCARCVPIGERRGSSYYLQSKVEQAWGGLVKADGSPRRSSWLNLSGSMPLLGDPEGFMAWWEKNSVPLVRSNFVA